MIKKECSCEKPEGERTEEPTSKTTCSGHARDVGTHDLNHFDKRVRNAESSIKALYKFSLDMSENIQNIISGVESFVKIDMKENEIIKEQIETMISVILMQSKRIDILAEMIVDDNTLKHDLCVYRGGFEKNHKCSFGSILFDYPEE